jgi:serine/threonine protein kinase
VFHPKHDHTHSAPEVLLLPDLLGAQKCCFGFAADIWTFGSLVYNMLTGVPAFTGFNESELHTSIREYKFDSDSNMQLKLASDPLKELLAGCLTTDPAARLSPDDIIKCSFL